MLADLSKFRHQIDIYCISSTQNDLSSTDYHHEKVNLLLVTYCFIKNYSHDLTNKNIAKLWVIVLSATKNDDYLLWVTLNHFVNTRLVAKVDD